MSRWPRAMGPHRGRTVRLAVPNRSVRRAAPRGNVAASGAGGGAAASRRRPLRVGSRAGKARTQGGDAAATRRDRVRGRTAAGDGMISRLWPDGLMKTTKDSSFSGSRRLDGRPRDPVSDGRAPQTSRSPRAASTPSARCPAGWRRSASSSLPISMPATSRPAAASSAGRPPPSRHSGYLEQRFANLKRVGTGVGERSTSVGRILAREETFAAPEPALQAG